MPSEVGVVYLFPTIIGNDSEQGGATKVKWEWLGDSGGWSSYADDVSEVLTKGFVSGKEELMVLVARNVKMKIRFKNGMNQSNVSTGWSRDIRCVPVGRGDEQTKGLWEWQEGGAWKRFPESARRFLAAAQVLSVDEVGLSLQGKPYLVRMNEEEMENEETCEIMKIRLVEPTDAVWEWEDEGHHWIPYTDADNQTIEEAHSAGDTVVALTILGRVYNLNLKKMTQENMSTNVVRNIRRVLPDNKPHPPVPASSASSSKTRGKNKRPKEEEEDDDDDEDIVISKKRKKVKAEEEEEEEEVKTKSTGEVKSQTFSGDAPVDSECKTKLGKASVYSEGKEVWNSMLNQTNLKNNNNKFYLLQLLKDNGKNSYSVWFRWGRVGKAGQHDLFSFGNDLDSAKNTFRKKFEDKTKNRWEDRHDFVKVPGKYDLLEMDYGIEEEVDAPVKDDTPKPKPVSKLDKRVQDLIDLICDVKSMEDVIKEMKYDVRKAPLGKLTKSQIKLGYTALQKIETIIVAGKTSGDALYKACDEFYTRVPHDFGMSRPPLITTREEIKQKLALLEALGDIQIALTVIQKTDEVGVHPLDQQYKQLHCNIEPLHDEEMTDLIKKFVKQTHGKTHNTFKLKVKQIFELKRDGEEEQFRDVGNRQLLWHGSRLTNWVGILSQGLRIAPPEAPITGYMFGKGLYFADMCSKSANYCFATRSRNEGLVLLSEVSLGTPNELLSADYNAHKLPAGTHSVKGKGRMVPNPSHDHTLPDGCVMPLGTSIDTHLANTSGGYTLNYNEYIVYTTNQVKMRYLVLLEFQFK